MTRIGFVGLGHMGLPMAINLVKAGHEVSGFDLQTSAVDALVKKGGHGAKDLADLAQEKEVLITMLQTGDQVKSVCLGPSGLFQHGKPDALFIDCSSIDVQSSRDIHHEAQAHGLKVMDAPVSGGVAGAEAATLTFMVGGDEEAYALGKDILSAMGQTIIHTGQAGSGQAAKICNNMILGVSMIAVSEGFELGKRLGLAPEKLFEVVNHASGQCWVMSKYPPLPGLLDNVPANRDYQPGFTSSMMLKDLNTSQHAAQVVKVDTAVAACATALYQRWVDHGHGEMDFSSIIQSFQDEEAR